MRLRRALLVAIPLGLITVAVCAYVVFKGQVYTIHIERQTIQEVIDRHVPYEYSIALVARLRVTQMAVHLSDGADRVGLTATLVLELPGRHRSTTIEGSVSAHAGLRYDPATFSFFLVDPIVDHLAVQGIPARYTDALATHIPLVLRHIVTPHPVYQIPEAGLRPRLARAVLKDVAVVNGRLVICLGY